MAEAKSAGCAIVLPVDGVIAREFKAGAANETVAIDKIPGRRMVLDVGAQSVKTVNDWMLRLKHWSGTAARRLRNRTFRRGNRRGCQFAAEETKGCRLVSVAGGGDTVSALNHAGVADDFSYVSTAGGAFSNDGRQALPGVEVLHSVK